MENAMNELETKRLHAEINQRYAETNLANKRVKWYEVILIATGSAGLVSLGVAVAKLFQ